MQSHNQDNQHWYGFNGNTNTLVEHTAIANSLRIMIFMNDF